MTHNNGEKIEQNDPSSDAPEQNPNKEIAAKLLDNQVKESRKKFNKIPKNTAFSFTKHAKLTYQNRMRR